MPIESRLTPSKQEIEHQLGLILASPVFLPRERPSHVLTFVVQAALNGDCKKIVEKDIMEAVFTAPSYAAGSSVARVNANYMRKLISQYYATIGKHDPVIIEFRAEEKQPQAKRTANYLPSFKYHPRHKVVRMHRIAGHFLKRSSPYDLAASYYSHLSVIGEQPDNFAAWMSIAETLLAAHFLDYFIWPGRTIHHIEEAVAAAIRLNPDDWQSHAISGTLCLARRQFHEASVHYQAALHCDPNDMPRYGWYQAFLFAADRSDEALELLLTRTIENPTDAMDYAIYGLGLYAARMFDAAEEELQMAIQLDSQCWLAYLVNSLNYIALDEPDLAILNIERLENIPRRFQWRMFGPMILAFHMEIQSSSEPSERNYYKRRFAKIIRHLEKQEWYLNERNDPRTYRYRELGFDWPQYNVPWYGLQMAGVLMAAGQSEFAIEHIEVAWSAGSPLIMWLHQMPIFDPLLKYDRFQYLLRHRLDHPPGH